MYKIMMSQVFTEELTEINLPAVPRAGEIVHSNNNAFRVQDVVYYADRTPPVIAIIVMKAR